MYIARSVLVNLARKLHTCTTHQQACSFPSSPGGIIYYTLNTFCNPIANKAPIMVHQTTILPILLSLALTTTAIPNRRDDSSPGVDIANMGSATQTFYFCNNVANYDGGADPGLPCKLLVTSVVVAPSKTAAVSLGTTFSGRVVRATETPATWVEMQFTSQGAAWADVSLQVGCDGAAQVGPADGGSALTVGFEEPRDIVKGAPEGTTETRGDGVEVVSIPWSEGVVVNHAAADYLVEKVGNAMAYITTTTDTKVTTSSDNRLKVWFY